MSVLMGTGRAPGACGELIAGFTEPGQPFHVTLPIDRYATVTVTVTESTGWSLDGPPIDNVWASILATCSLLGVGPFHIQMEHATELEYDKGLGASTADMVAASRALASAVGRTLTPADEARIATGISPSYGTMYPGPVAFNPMTGELIDEYEWWPELAIALIIPDTRKPTLGADFSQRKSVGSELALYGLRDDAGSRCGGGFLDIGWRSARAYLQWGHIPMYDVLINAFEWAGALSRPGAAGFALAHTGTVGGLLFILPVSGDERAAAIQLAESAVHRLRQTLDFRARVELVFTPAPSQPHT